MNIIRDLADLNLLPVGRANTATPIRTGREVWPQERFAFLFTEPQF